MYVCLCMHISIYIYISCLKQEEAISILSGKPLKL